MRTPGHFLCMLFCISTVFLLATHVKYFKNQGRETPVVRKSLVETLGPVKAASGQLPFWCSEDPNKDSVGQKAWENGRREEDNLMNSLFPRHLAADWWLLAPLHPPPTPPSTLLLILTLFSRAGMQCPPIQSPQSCGKAPTPINTHLKSTHIL